MPFLRIIVPSSPSPEGKEMILTRAREAFRNHCGCPLTAPFTTDEKRWRISEAPHFIPFGACVVVGSVEECGGEGAHCCRFICPASEGFDSKEENMKPLCDVAASISETVNTAIGTTKSTVGYNFRLDGGGHVQQHQPQAIKGCHIQLKCCPNDKSLTLDIYDVNSHEISSTEMLDKLHYYLNMLRRQPQLSGMVFRVTPFCWAHCLGCKLHVMTNRDRFTRFQCQNCGKWLYACTHPPLNSSAEGGGSAQPSATTEPGTNSERICSNDKNDGQPSQPSDAMTEFARFAPLLCAEATASLLRKPFKDYFLPVELFRAMKRGDEALYKWAKNRWNVDPAECILERRALRGDGSPYFGRNEDCRGIEYPCQTIVKDGQLHWFEIATSQDLGKDGDTLREAQGQIAQYKLSDLRQMKISKLKGAMNDAGVSFNLQDVVEKQDMINVFQNSGRLLVLPENDDES